MKIAHGTLVMAIDGEKMLLLQNKGDQKFLILETLVHDDIDNPPSHDQGSDASGRAFTGSLHRRSAYEQTDWHRQAEERFIRVGAARFEQLAANQDNDLVVIAPARTLGLVRRHLSTATRARVIAEIGKDLVHRESDDIAAAIDAHAAHRTR